MKLYQMDLAYRGDSLHFSNKAFYVVAPDPALALEFAIRKMNEDLGLPNSKEIGDRYTTGNISITNLKELATMAYAERLVLPPALVEAIVKPPKDPHLP